MKTKQYDKIRGREALKRVLEGERIYDINCVGEATAYFLNDKNEFCGEYAKRETFVSGITVDEAVRLYDWYVKKPFDVRAEMLARPNEWVGAFEYNRGQWFLVGFDKSKMSATKVRITNNHAPVDCSHEDVYPVTDVEIDKCVSIEDVLEEN